MKRARGIPVALVAITAALTLLVGIGTTHSKPSYPQVSPQTVDAAATSTQQDLAEIRLLQRASRSRPVAVAKPPVRRHVTNTKNTKTAPTVVRRHVSVKPVVKAQVVRKERPSVSRGTGAYAWAHTTDAIKVANCESGDRSDNSHYNGNAHLRGKYSGKWQMDSDFWSTYGGRQFGYSAADASESEQDIVAYKGYQARGWQPWSCSRIMGVR